MSGKSNPEVWLEQLYDGKCLSERDLRMCCEMVKELLMGMLGPQASNAYSNTLVRMSKLQCAQMYAASIMFGYFLRKADKRFKLDRAMGTLPMNPMDSAKALEELFL